MNLVFWSSPQHLPIIQQARASYCAKTVTAEAGCIVIPDPIERHETPPAEVIFQAVLWAKF